MPHPYRSAFPTNAVYGGPDNDIELESFDPGMSFRDYFAAQALQGILANPAWDVRALPTPGATEAETIARAGRLAVRYAESLIAALRPRRLDGEPG